ncbi:MAG TPA: hypothetical protein VIJ95_01065 [Hanamia sp.]
MAVKKIIKRKANSGHHRMCHGGHACNLHEKKQQAWQWGISITDMLIRK